MKIVIFGLSITSSWGNGHATTYRSLCRALHRRGHSIHFVEKDVPWYSQNRDLPSPDFCKVHLYKDWRNEQGSLTKLLRDADVVIIGSYFADAITAADLLFASVQAPILFYDIDTPVTIASLRRTSGSEYLRADQIAQYDAYLSFTGGPILDELRQTLGARIALPLYCSVDPEAYRQTRPSSEFKCDLSYLGTYAADRQDKLMKLLNEPARQLSDHTFIVAGPQYPETRWSQNVRRIDHVPPRQHAALYSSSRYSLNLTRADMIAAGFSPSVRLFEAAACGSAIISDRWQGIDLFLEPGREIILVNSTEDVVAALKEQSEGERIQLGQAARDRILSAHTSHNRALEFETIVETVYAGRRAHLEIAEDELTRT